jgi:RsiW-degrading membrane proteinase PrsW (M82 family)
MPAIRATEIETEPAWGQQESLYQPQRAAFWLFVALCLIGGFLLFARVAPALSVHIGATSLTLVVWAAYTVPFVLVIVALDLLEPEPPAFLASAFAWGAIVATSIAMVANSSTQSIMAKTLGVDFTRTWWSALSGPTTEEVIKALGLVVIVLVARRQVNTIMDGLVYGLFVGLGFQVAENLVYTSDKLQMAVFGGNPGRVVVDVFVLRGLALGLWSHAVYTAMVGAGIAYAFLRKDVSRIRRGLVLATLFMAAWVLHFLWNAPFFQPERGSSFRFENLPVYVAKGLPALALVAVLYLFARRREVVWFADALRGEPDVEPGELEALTTFAGRRAARRAAKECGGRPAARALERLQRAQVQLAVACARAADDRDRTVEAARLAVRRARSQLDAVGCGDRSPGT